MRTVLLSFLAFCCGGASLYAQDLSAFEKRIFINPQGETMRYRVLLPEGFDAEQRYPLLLFLHGAGERGGDNAAQLIHGAELFLQPENRSAFPAIVLFPQCPKDSNWYSAISGKGQPAGARTMIFGQEEPTAQLRLAHELVQYFMAAGQVDTQRVYISGLSMGGLGTFEMLRRYPDTFVAAAPICGGGDPTAVSAYADKVAIWIFHGLADGVVPAAWSKAMHKALKKARAEVKISLYKGVNHNSWENAFAEPTYLSWIFSHQRQ